VFFFAGEQAVTKANRMKIIKHFNIKIALDITTSGFESSLKVQHIYLKEENNPNYTLENIIFQINKRF
jgi:hypothetical protein